MSLPIHGGITQLNDKGECGSIVSKDSPNGISLEGMLNKAMPYERLAINKVNHT